jgi:hypothetical protein
MQLAALPCSVVEVTETRLRVDAQAKQSCIQTAAHISGAGTTTSDTHGPSNVTNKMTKGHLPMCR